MRKNISKAVSKVLASVLCASTMCIPAYGALNGFQVEKISSGYAITGINTNAIMDGTVTIPAVIDGTNVTQLGASSQSYTFLGRQPVSRFVIGKSVRGSTAYAFFGARELEEIEAENRALHFDPAEKPTGLSLAYNEPSLKYYQRTSEDAQNVLALATRRTAIEVDVSISVNDLVISKQDLMTRKSFL